MARHHQLLLLRPRGGGEHEPGREGVAVQRGPEVEVAGVAQRVVLMAPRRRRTRARRRAALPPQLPHKPAQRQHTPTAPPARRRRPSGGVALCHLSSGDRA
jgi:hypothetical protein